MIREYIAEDLDALRRMHSHQAFEYPFPNLADPIFVSKLVVTDDSGSPVMAALARLTCEIYLLMDGRAGKPVDRLSALVSLHAAGTRDLATRGLEDAHAWLPPSIARRFGRRLEGLGWIRDDVWTPYCYRFRRC